MQLGIKHQYVSRWRKDVSGTLTKNQLKHNAIQRAGELFDLSPIETEALANSAGLSLHSLSNADGGNGFVAYFNGLLDKYQGKIKELCELACVSERMFRYIRKGEHIRKEPLVALLLTMGVCINIMQNCLKKAGYVLSRSIPTDTVVLWLIENEPKMRAYNPVNFTNEILYSLGLPLLMTRTKTDNS